MKDKAAGRFLVVSLSNIGDVILTTPVIMQILSAFPHAEITVVAGPKAEPLLKNSYFIRRLVTYDKKASWFQKLKFIQELRRDSYEAVVDLRNTAIPFLVSAHKRSPTMRKHKKTSMRARHLEVLEWTGFSLQGRVPAFDFFGSEEQNSARIKISQCGAASEEGWIVVSAGAASSRKRWPLKFYDEVIRQYLSKYKQSVILTGDAAERDYVEPLCRIHPSRVFNLAGKATLKESAAMIAAAELLLTNDSAAMHLGHELGRRVVAVFGPTNPDAYGREGEFFKVIRPQGNLPREDQEEKECDFFPGVTVERVFNACSELMQKKLPAEVSAGSF